MDSPQYLNHKLDGEQLNALVLNLIINGQSSILGRKMGTVDKIAGFKPYYKWIVLNTNDLIIDTIVITSFKPYYKWIVLNTLDLKKNIDFMTF